MPFIIKEGELKEVSHEVMDEWIFNNYKEPNSAYFLRETFTVDFKIITSFDCRTGEWCCRVIDLNADFWEDATMEREMFPFEQIRQASDYHDEAVKFYKSLDMEDFVP